MTINSDYLASKDGTELREMRDHWALDGYELEALNVELELRGIPVEADCVCGHSLGSHVQADWFCHGCDDREDDDDLDPVHRFEAYEES